MRGMRMRSMYMDEQSSARVTWDVLVSSPLNGCRGCILADGWTALDFALHRGDQREGDCGCQHPRSHGERCVHSELFFAAPPLAWPLAPPRALRSTGGGADNLINRNLIKRFKPECSKAQMPNSSRNGISVRYCMHVTYFRSFPREQMKFGPPDLLPIADAGGSVTE